MSADFDHDHPKREILYQIQTNNLKEEFEQKHFVSKHQFLLQNEQMMKRTFKEMYDFEEENAYLDMNFEGLLDDCRLAIISQNEFEFKGNADALKVIRQVLDFSKENLENIQTNLATLENFTVIEQFLDERVKPSFQSQFAEFSRIERDFDEVDSVYELKETFSKLQDTFHKALKVAKKSRELKICFPYEPSIIQELSHPDEKNPPTKDKIEKLGATCRAFFNQVIKECEAAIALANTKVHLQEVRLAERKDQRFDQSLL